jgi:two-component system, OmpR family, response regulator
VTSIDSIAGAAPVLLIEDDLELAQEIMLSLTEAGYTVRHEGETTPALDVARAAEASVILADRMIGGEDFLPNIELLRREGVATPVLLISALSSVDERIRGLKSGGDDYLMKPFAICELVARVDALTRRIARERTTILRVGCLEMDLIKRSVRRGDRTIDLLPREFKILEYFMRRPEQVITRAMLLQDVWNYQFVPHTNVVDVHIGKVRKKIDGPGEIALIENVRGAGFKLRVYD